MATEEEDLTFDVLRHAEGIILREDISLDYVQQRYPALRNLDSAIDIVFSSPPPVREDIIPHIAAHGDVLDWLDGETIGACISLTPARHPNNAFDRDAYVATFSALVDHVLRTTGRRVLLFSHITHDLPSLRRIVENAGEPGRVRIFPPELDSTVQRGAIGQLGFFISTRYHPTIFAVQSQIPFFCVKNQFKVDGMLAKIGLAEVPSCWQDDDLALQRQAFDESWARRDDVRAQLGPAAARAAEWGRMYVDRLTLWDRGQSHRASRHERVDQRYGILFRSGSLRCPLVAAASTSDIASFYDDFSTRLLRDYVRGNRRVQAAIALVLDSIPPRAHSLLDIGCGIGVSSHAVARANGHLQVVAADISPRNIAIAKRLFDDANLSFHVSDMSTIPDGSPFDVISILDVYEHIPSDRRHGFHRVVSQCLKPDGVVVVTCPTPLHQEYLRHYEPGGLQVIDETITLKDILRLADDIDACVTRYEMISMWRQNQYFHAVLQRSPSYESLSPKPAVANSIGARVARKASQIHWPRAASRPSHAPIAAHACIDASDWRLSSCSSLLGVRRANRR